MKQIFFDDMDVAKISKYLSYSMVLAWAILCGESIYRGNWKTSITCFSSGVLMLFAADEVYDARLLKQALAEEQETFLTVKMVDGNADVVAAGTPEDLLTLCSAAAKFSCDPAAESDFTKMEIARKYKRMFNTMLTLYAEKKGIDKDELFELVGLHKLD